MKSLMSLVFLIPMTLSAQTNAAAPSGSDQAAILSFQTIHLPDRDYPRPGPNPRYCPDGMHREYDEYRGRYICVEDERYRYDECETNSKRLRNPCIEDRQWEMDKNRHSIEKMSEAVGSGDSAANGAAQAAFFDGSTSFKTGDGDGVVAAPSVTAYSLAIPEDRWKLLHTNPEVPVPTIGKPRPAYFQAGRNKARVIQVIEPEHRDMMQETGQAIQDKIIEKAIDKVIEKVDNANKAIDNIGNGLRSDGDSALQKGTQAQKDAERKYGK